MSHQFQPGDDLIFQLESGYGLLRLLAVDGEGADTIWHLMAYDEFFPDVETAEAALLSGVPFPVRRAHMALTSAHSNERQLHGLVTVPYLMKS